MSRTRRGDAALALTTLLLAACQAAATSTPGRTSTPSPSPELTATATPIATPAPTGSPTTTPAASETFPATPVVATLDIAYDSSGAPFDPAKVGGLIPGQVQGSWYRSAGFYVVVYATVELTETGSLCPGNSIETASGYEFVSNAPTAPEACTGQESTLAPPPVGVRFCSSLASGAFAYLTAIPATTEGVLYASIERAQPGGSIVGITGRAATTAGPAPEVDLEALGCSPVPGL